MKKFIALLITIIGGIYTFWSKSKSRDVATEDEKQHDIDNTKSNDLIKEVDAQLKKVNENISVIEEQTIIKQNEIHSIVDESNKEMNNIKKIISVEGILDQNNKDWDKI